MTTDLRPLTLARRAREVAIACGNAAYDCIAPYSPGSTYPEYPFGAEQVGPQLNGAYDTVRESLHLLGLDADRFGTPAWNPLGELVRPGDTVVLKPNFVRDFRETHAGLDDCVITHGAVLRASADFVYIALQGRGRLIIADAPQNDADFDRIREINCLAALQDFYAQHAQLPLEVYDLRPECAQKVDGVIVGHRKLSGDPQGYTHVNLGLHSEFAEVNRFCDRLYGSEYDMGELYRHHHDETHEYLISKTVLAADVVISVPKLKTHKKVGLTVNLKNLVGINGNKNWLPHHREGTPSEGGDQFADDAVKRKVERAAVTRFKQLFPLLGPLRPLVAGPIKALGKRVFGDTNTDTIRSGNWYGNDTCWRMSLDLNRILVYADADGNLHDQPVRRFFSLVDGIVGGEGNGPLDPTARAAGLILAGFNPVAVDLACARLMGFDHLKIPILHRALAEHPFPLTSFAFAEVSAHSNNSEFGRALAAFAGPTFQFAPHFGWRGHIELSEEACEAGAVA